MTYRCADTMSFPRGLQPVRRTGRRPAGAGRRNAGRRRRAFSYLDAVISALILGLSVTASMNLYGSFIRGAVVEKERQLAMELASDLLAEMLTRAFEDPGLAPGSFGADADEPTRKDYDDVDDYAGWNESPPRNLNGTVMSGYPNFRREVRVWNVQLADMKTVAANGTTPAKVIEVKVLVSGKVRATATGFRLRHSGYE